MSDDSLCKMLLDDCWSALKNQQTIKLIDAQKDNIQFINGETKHQKLTPLMIASREGLLDIVSHLIPLLFEHKCDINQTDKRGNSALMHASWEGHHKIVKLLIENGSDVNHEDNFGNTSLLLASSDIHTEVVSLLLEHGANKNHINKKGQTAIFLAQKIVNTGKIIDLLLE
jgi:serine/threonine-protein phosphatase 6 regulatory ankyrin repeat subunit B